MLKFNDPKGWLSTRVEGVKRAYFIPNGVNGIAVDIGANVGAFEIVNHKKFNKIIAIEAGLETYQRCLKNTENIDNVVVKNYAVAADDVGTIKLRHYKDGAQSGNATTLDDPKWYNDSDYEDVYKISLESIFTVFNLDKINYLKIDCEGAEYDFLMDKDLSKVDYIGVEIHIQLGDKAKELMRHIEKTHEPIKKMGDGKTMHFEYTYKNRNI